MTAVATDQSCHRLDALHARSPSRFGGLIAVNDVSFTIPQGGIVSLIGPNGAGKTTFFNVAHRALQADRGAGACSATRTSPACRRTRSLRSGMARTFQNIRLFGLMTAEENVMVAMHSHLQVGHRPARSSRTPWQRREEREAHEQAHELLEFVGHRQGTPTSTRATCPTATSAGSRWPGRSRCSPQVLLLDEPTAGMNPQESAQFVDFVHRVRDEKQVSVLLIEHDMSVVMRVVRADHGARPGREDRRGRPGRDPVQRAGDRGLPRQDRYARGGAR